MVRFLVRTALTALVITFLVPAFGGHFSGGFFPQGFVYGLLFALVTWGLWTLVGMFILGSAGTGLIIVVPFVLFCGWLIPAIELKVLAHFAHSLQLGWGTAILAGLVLLLVNGLTSKPRTTTSR